MYDYGDGEDYAMEDDDKVVSVPVILSQPRIIQSAIGQNIILPCSVDNLPGNTSQISQRELKGLWEACSGFVTQLECALNNQDIYEEYVPQNGQWDLESYLPLDFGHSRQLSKNKFFDPSTPSMKKGRDREKQGGKKGKD